MLLVLIAASAVGFVTWLGLGKPFAKHPLTKGQIEHVVAQRTRGRVHLVLCNEFVSSQTPRPDHAHTWTCDTYLGQSTADQRNGPSYEVTVRDDRIQAIRRVPTH